jgi:nucleoside-diphosphate-sugar epimerase
VDDLADLVVAGLRSDVTGTFPVADDEPCTSLALAEWTCEFLRIPLLVGEPKASGREDGKKGRRVDGSACRKKLGLQLRFPSYRQGVPASLAVETASSIESV